MLEALLYCWRSGEIEIGSFCPEDALPLASGDLHALERAVSGTARLAYDNTTWLVPGVPEAESDDAALEAVLAYKPRLESALRAAAREPAHA